MTEFDEEELAAFRVWKDRLIFSEMSGDYININNLMGIMHRYIRLSGCHAKISTDEDTNIRYKMETLDLLKGSLQ